MTYISSSLTILTTYGCINFVVQNIVAEGTDRHGAALTPEYTSRPFQDGLGN